ncbi:MAG: serine hydrolase domain-containing protein [Bacteroidota bacterium]
MAYLFLASLPLGAQSHSTFEARVNSLVRSGTLPSLAVGVLKDGQIVYEQAFGLADHERKVAATVHTPYQLASLTKPFTATAVMQLAQSGRLGLDDPITRYVRLQKADSSFADPTLRQVLNHTAGLGTYFDIYYADEAIRPVSFAEAWAQYGIQFQPPGLVCEYSNLGYGLLGHVVEQVTGQAFGDYVQQHIFAPLGMENSFLVDSAAGSDHLAPKYDPELEPLPEVWNNTPGAGNLAASVRDLLTFGRAQLNPTDFPGLPTEAITEMHTYREPDALFHYYQATRYTLGWYRRDDDGGQPVVWHEGGMMGASTVLKLYPEEDLALVLLTNTYQPAVLRQLTDALTSEFIAKYQPSPLNELAEYTSVAADSAWLGTWEGWVQAGETRMPLSLSIAADGIELSYTDERYRSFLTDGQPLPIRSQLLFGAVNQSYFVGTGMGELPTADRRGALPHLWSFKFYREGNTLRGTLVSLAAGTREYYAKPYALELRKR